MIDIWIFPKISARSWCRMPATPCLHDLMLMLFVWVWSKSHSYRRKFRSQTSDNMDRWKAEQGRGREKRKIRREKIREEKRVRRKKMQMRKKVGKSRFTVFFPMICGSGGSKSRLAKAAGAEPAGQMRDEKLHAVVARSTFPSQNAQNTPFSDHYWKLRCRKSARRCGAKHISKSKMYKTPQLRTTFGSWDVAKVHAVVVRSTFPSQNVQNTPFSDHFWRFRSRKSARRFGAKHISKSKCQNHTRFGPLLEVQMSKQCMPLWRKAHFEVKMFKTLGVWTTFGGSDVASLHYTYTTLHYTTLHYTTLHYITLHSSTLHYTTLHSSALHYTEWHYTTPTLHYTTLHLHYTTLHIELHYSTLHYTSLHYTYTIFHYTSLPYTTLHYTPLHYNYKLHNYTPLHSTTLNYTTLHYTTLHSATLHYTTLHYTTLRCTEWHCTTDRQVDR